MQKLKHHKTRALQKAHGLARNVLIRTASSWMPYYIVNEYPKSGGTWIGQMLAELLGVPFPRNRFPILQPSMVHGHYYEPSGIKNVVLVWRDPRDLMVSFYYHCYFEHSNGHNKALVRIMQDRLPFADNNDIKNNLPIFLEVMLTDPVSPRFSWSAFVRKWANNEHASHVRYEAMRRKPVETLTNLYMALTGRSPDLKGVEDVVDKYSFERQSGRKPGEENKTSFARKGVIGDWRNHFTKDAAAVFERYAGRELRLLEYEVGTSWVDECKGIVGCD